MRLKPSAGKINLQAEGTQYNVVLQDDKKDVGAIKKTAKECRDSGSKNFAEAALPVLTHHLDTATAITAKN